MVHLSIIFKDEIFALLITKKLVETAEYDLFIDIAQILIQHHKSMGMLLEGR